MPPESCPPPVGLDLPDWKPASRPSRLVLVGRHCRLEPLDPAAHADPLHAANTAGPDGRMWTYLPYGPFATADEYRDWVQRVASGDDPFFFAIIDVKTDRPVGVAAWLRIDPANGVIEIGHLAFSPALQRTTAATEALYLLIREAFKLGYRRCEWKCDTLNAPSRTAAERLGFIHEGVFRQASVVKGRNRDTAWYAIIDRDWPGLQVAFERWLAPDNFDLTGRQKQSLRALTKSP